MKPAESLPALLMINRKSTPAQRQQAILGIVLWVGLLAVLLVQ